MTAPGSRGAAIEVLYFAGCPNYEPLVTRLGELLDRTGVEAEIELRRVESDGEARRSRFLGSPTIRVDGRDVDPEAGGRTDYGLKCRLYRAGDGVVGTPPERLIIDALGAAVGDGSTEAPGAAPAPRGGEILTGAPLRNRLEGCPAGFRDLHAGVLQSFLAGRTPDSEELRLHAGELEIDLDEALADLERRDVLWLDPGNGSVAVAYPFSGGETPHRVDLSASGTQVFGMCALDALGIPFLAHRPATVRSRDAITGEAIEVRIDPTGVRGWEPRRAVVVAAVAGDGPSADSCCPHVNFLTSRERAAELLGGDAATSGRVLGMAEAIDLARAIFGGLLDDAELP